MQERSSAISRKAMKHRLTLTALDIDDLIVTE